ncbi:MAG: hypothetical protein ACI959_000069 [Limisphaerales bacterium]|jgi:hypothetical protein
MNTKNWFAYNMGFSDIIVHYVVMMLIGIIGGLAGNIWIMLFAIPFMLSAVLAWSPVFLFFGRDTFSEM